MNQQHFNAVFNRLTERRREMLLKLLANEKDEAIAKSLNIAPTTVRKYRQKICEIFGLTNEFTDQHHSKFPELIALFAKYKPELLNPNTSYLPKTEKLGQKKTISENYNFVGREDAIAHLDKLVNEGAKVILIHAEGGVGKTTLARKWFEFQGLLPLKLPIIMTPQNIQSVEDWVRFKLKDCFQINPEPNFEMMLEQLKNELQTPKIGFLIDSLELSLINGEFIEPYQRYYVKLLKVLADTSVKSITLITSRELLSEDKLKSEEIKTYQLEGLKVDAWKNYFKINNIHININAVSEMNQAYGGNAEAMSLICADIKDEFKCDLSSYWLKTHNELLANPKLDNLVKRQFNKLRKDNLQAYKLLCRLGVYPNQDSAVPKIWLFCLLWDLPASCKQKVINALRVSSLVKHYDKEYYLHRVIRTVSVENFSLMNGFNNNQLLLIKEQIDAILESDPELQLFLVWVQQKSSSVRCTFNQQSIRAFYFHLALSMNHAIYHLCPNPVIALFEETFNPELALALGLNLTNEYEKNNDIYLDIELAYAFGDAPKKADVKQYSLKPDLVNLLQYMENKILDYSASMNFFYGISYEKSWQDEWAIEVQYLAEQLRLMLIKYRNIGHEWKFTEKQQCLLQQYYDANKLLVYCLDSASEKMRLHIEDTLLLPIAEIEKRPFKN
ncbi:MAG: LuxR C-terminal-related transcriptional regulator [Nostoc sp. DedQUE12b]|uniref:NACHT C-terminal helical domain 2-containing protein n=1 Tax=Nostoc sp. DedQUE12b TaxID=3075398 RepID=UPI002AD2B14D|nr:LuxR C-terminal-related transcriptional regulator [Nostoc sp. DedQUE12b]MDZ8087264.1 LuxR C-terminal-related transcriptional regulator [Nostoc sp. DedQUE12b]